MRASDSRPAWLPRSRFCRWMPEIAASFVDWGCCSVGSSGDRHRPPHHAWALELIGTPWQLPVDSGDPETETWIHQNLKVNALILQTLLWASDQSQCSSPLNVIMFYVPYVIWSSRMTSRLGVGIIYFLHFDGNNQNNIKVHYSSNAKTKSKSNISWEISVH